MPFIADIAHKLQSNGIDYKVNDGQTELKCCLMSEHKVMSLRGAEVKFSVSITFMSGEHFEAVLTHPGAGESESFGHDEAEATEAALELLDKFHVMVGGDGGSYDAIDKFMAYHAEMANLAEALDGLRDAGPGVVERRREPQVF